MQKITTKISLPLFLILISFLVVSCSSPEINIYNEDIDEDIAYHDDWEARYDDEAAYYNNTNGPINILKGPGKSYDLVDYLPRGESGFIQGCNFDLKWCFLNFGGKPKSGWVAMDFLKSKELEK